MASRMKALLIALIFLGISVALIWWIYNGDRGYLVIEGDAPQEIAGMLVGNQQCPQTPCRLTIYPGMYDTVFTKNGYYDIRKSIRVNLFEETKIQLRFIEIPHVQLQGAIASFSYHIEKASDTYSDNQNMVLLPFRSNLTFINKIPLQNGETVKTISFSSTGSGAVIQTNKRDRFIWDGTEQSILFPPSSSSFVWDNNNAVYFWSSPSLGVQELWSISGNTTQKEGTFYNLRHGLIFPSPTKIIIADGKINYLLDTKEGRKSVVLSNDIIVNGKWNSDGQQFLYQTTDGIIHLFDGTTRIDMPTTFSATIDLIDFYTPDTLIYGSPIENKVLLSIYSFLQNTNKTILEESLPGTTQQIEKVQDKVYLEHNNTLYTIEGVIL